VRGGLPNSDSAKENGLPNSDSAKENGLPNSDSANAGRHTFLKVYGLFGKSEFANP